MREYKIERLYGDKIYVVEFEAAPTTFQGVLHGPYKNEDSAKRRIRDLKRKAIPMLSIEEPPQPIDDGSCDPLYGQRMDSADMGEEFEYTELTIPFVVRPMGVYPAIPKKLYRAQWRPNAYAVTTTTKL